MRFITIEKEQSNYSASSGLLHIIFTSNSVIFLLGLKNISYLRVQGTLATLLTLCQLNIIVTNINSIRNWYRFVTNYITIHVQ